MVNHTSRRSPDPLASETRRVVAALEVEGLAKKTVKGYRYALERAHRVLATHGKAVPLDQWTDRQFALVREGLQHDYHMLSFLNSLLKRAGSVRRFKIKITPRRFVRWLSDEDSARLLKTAIRMGPPYSILVRLELQHGFRRVSVFRAKVGDFQNGSVYVHGKGAFDYTLPAHPDLAREISRTLEWRKRCLEARAREVREWSARANGWTQTDLLIPSRQSDGGKGAYSEQGADCVLRKVSRAAGIRTCSHHDLRRTFGRNLWEAGVRIEVISELMGHSSIDMTRKYLGLNSLDQRDGMRALVRWEKRRRR